MIYLLKSSLFLTNIFKNHKGSLIYTLRGFDPDGDPLTFGIRHSSYDSEVLRIETAGNNEANVYLNKELDRETRDEYSIVLTLTDNRLGDGNYVTQSLLLLVEDINDNEPVFRPYQSTLEVPEDSPPGILATLEATDLDEGAYGQVRVNLLMNQQPSTQFTNLKSYYSP